MFSNAPLLTVSRKLNAKLGRAAVLASTLALCAGSTVASDSDNLPDSITLQGVVRDFRYYNAHGGHPDFQHYNTGHIVGLVAEQLDDEGKPVRSGSSGKTVQSQARDSHGNFIAPNLYNPSLGDTPPSLSNYRGTTITSDQSFSQWYRDVPGVNLSKNIDVTLQRVPGTDVYRCVFEDNDNTSEREGFFPIDNDLYADADPDWHHNYSFTFELDTQFTVHKNAGQVFTFQGDDDVWVFIDGRLVIDIGGVHSAVRQSVDIDRLDWLEDGQKASLKFFFAERHTTRSNFRLETNLNLQSIQAPPTTALYD